ncbi:VOC family protein [Chengkuizengella axinellae]|uniref:VOC family protein n=1 Tax=Chengkuizengella axinellae TaxID=3064388 RepID=A0ABT9IZU0_9BACL|nr:VOC family protein [Chengkuizengella sp. 2205SS18-9]MDP5274884.1 VOC family protein [Chengkuizengella sp. 2205SS18-9]
MEKRDSLKQEQVLQKPMLKRVHCNYLPVSNLEVATKWYQEIFGLKARKCDPKEGSILILGDGQWLFLLESNEKRTSNFITDQWDGKGYEMFSLTFEVENIVELHKKLRENEVDVEPLVDQGSCGLQFKFKDPDGNKFNVWQDQITT